MITDCEKTRDTVHAVLGRTSAVSVFTVDDVEAAFQHFKRCGACRETLSPDDRGRFIAGVLLERE